MGREIAAVPAGRKARTRIKKAGIWAAAPVPPRRRGEIMIEIRGKYTTRVFTDVVDRSAISQVIELCNRFKAGDEG